MRTEFKWFMTLYSGVVLGVLTFWVWAYAPSNIHVRLEAEQIAKRMEPTRRGDRFYLLFDTKYGLMENQVSYAKYISSSNGRMVNFNLSLREYFLRLDEPKLMEEDYPMIKWSEWFMIFRGIDLLLLVIIMLLGFIEWRCWIVGLGMVFSLGLYYFSYL